MHLTNDQVLEKTGKPLAHWRSVLDRFGAASKKPRNVVGHLEARHRLPRFWATNLVFWYVAQPDVVNCEGAIERSPPATSGNNSD